MVCKLLEVGEPFPSEEEASEFEAQLLVGVLLLDATSHELEFYICLIYGLSSNWNNFILFFLDVGEVFMNKLRFLEVVPTDLDYTE